MQKDSIKFLAVPFSLLLITACGGGSEKSSTPTPKASETVQSQAPAITTGFGSPLDLGSGVNITLSEPEHFAPGKFASNWVKGQVANKFSVTIKNSGTAELDPATIVIASNAGGKNCVDVLDGDNNVNGQPTDMIAAGGSTTFNYGVACDAKVGDPLNLTVSIKDKLIAVNGKLK